MKISCTTQRFAGYLVAKCLKEWSNFTHFFFFFFYKKTSVPVMTGGCGSLLPSRYFQKINTLNVSFQGEGDVLTMSEKVTAFQKKFVLWREHSENRRSEMFPSLCDFCFGLVLLLNTM